jgi:hypothetical protein
MGGSFSTASDADLNVGAFELRNRNLTGRSLGLCMGFDGAIGGSSDGVAYNAEAYLLGASYRFGESSYVALCGGAGLGAIGDAVPFAYQFPAELSTELQAGPVRLGLYGRVRWITGDDARKEGSDTVSFADDFTAGATLRWGENERFWKTTTAGYGYFVGAHYQEFMGTSLVGLSLGISFWGGR